MTFPKSLLTAVFVFILSAIAVQGQTSAFTYQGRLMDGSQPANGTYHMQFRLFGSMVGDDQIGQTLVFDGTNSATLIYVVDGVFTAKLDFGVEAFKTTADRFLEISIKKPSEQAYGTIMPRQLITSVPYAVRALSAATADTATNVTGNLSGDVTGTQSATVVSTVGGQTAANVASGSAAANNATDANQANQIVKRDADGNFSAGTITANLNGNASTATNANNADSLSSNCVGCVTDNKIASVSGAKVTGSVANATNAANAANAANATTANNALNLGGAAASQYVLTTDSRLSDARTPTGAAGGALTGNYPNPTIAQNAVTGSNIADGSLGMEDIFAFNYSLTLPATTILGNTCATFEGTTSLNENDFIIYSMKNKPSGLIIDNHTISAADVANNKIVVNICNVISGNLTLPAGQIRAMIIRPGNDSSSLREGNPPLTKNAQSSATVTLKLMSNEK